jgi:uncharacterized protein (TIGR02145 family)
MKKNLLKIISVAILLLFVTIGCKKDKNVTNVTLDKNNITLDIGETATLKAVVYPEDAANKAVSWTSTNETVADVVNGIVTAKKVGKTSITVITEDGSFTAECVVTVTPEWIEISGVKWAKRNVDMPGTFAAKPEDAGMFYQWNSPIGWSSTDPLISSNGDTVWTIQSNSPISIWEKENDPCPVGWHVPTISELENLIQAGTEWTTLNNVKGRIFGTGDNTIFLPASGLRCYPSGGLPEDAETGEKIEVGYYWSNSSTNNLTSFISFDSSNDFPLGIGGPPAYQLRSEGYSVRCVAE